MVIPQTGLETAQSPLKTIITHGLVIALPIAYCVRTASLLKYYYNRGLTGGIQEVTTFSMTRIIQESALMVTMLDYHNTYKYMFYNFNN